MRQLSQVTPPTNVILYKMFVLLLYGFVLVPGLVMVRNQTRAVGSRKYRDFSSEQFEKAVEAVKSGISLRKAEEQFGIPRCSLNRAVRGENRGKAGRPFVLNEVDQNTLARCLCAAGDWGFPLTLYDIRLIVKAFLDRCGKTERRF